MRAAFLYLLIRNTTPGKIDEIRSIANEHNALIVEESLGATYKGKQSGSFGDYSLY